MRDELLVPHPSFLAIASDVATRAQIYRDMLREAIGDEDLSAIRSYLQQERALGGTRFQAMIEKALNRPVQWRPRGRPRAEAADIQRD